MMETPTIAQASDMLAAHDISPVELTQHCLDRIAAVDTGTRGHYEDVPVEPVAATPGVKAVPMVLMVTPFSPVMPVG